MKVNNQSIKLLIMHMLVNIYTYLLYMFKILISSFFCGFVAVLLGESVGKGGSWMKNFNIDALWLIR